ncbi:MAG: hypothetical protein WBX25_28895 [Rhodomicrobium sp.]
MYPAASKILGSGATRYLTEYFACPPNKATAEIKAAAQKYGHEPLKKLVDLMRGSNDPKVQVLAAREILQRAYGKPAQTIQGDPEKPLAVNVGPSLNKQTCQRHRSPSLSPRRE